MPAQRIFDPLRNSDYAPHYEMTQVLVNGVAGVGAQTKSHAVYSATSPQSSGSLVYLLRNLAASSSITVTSALGATAATVTESQPALLMLWHKNPQSNFVQDTERWYAPTTTSATTTDPWPAGPTDLNEGDSITTGVPTKSGDTLRLRMALKAQATTLAGADSFKLQYAAGSICSRALVWSDVDTTAGPGIWRGYHNAGITNHLTLSNTDQQLSVSSTSETYEEQNPSTTTPNGVTAGTDGEWDWSIQDNGAPTGTSYCFRMVQSSGALLKDYLDYPQLITNDTPNVPTQITLFDNEKVASTSPWFTFTSSDPNGEAITY